MLKGSVPYYSAFYRKSNIAQIGIFGISGYLNFANIISKKKDQGFNVYKMAMYYANGSIQYGVTFRKSSKDQSVVYELRYPHSGVVNIENHINSKKNLGYRCKTIGIAMIPIII